MQAPVKQHFQIETMTKINHLMIKIIVIFLFILTGTYKSIGQTNAIPVINQKEESILTSKINNTSYHLYVSLPQHYSQKDTIHYPVLYILDGGLAFPIAHAARTSLDLFGDLENVIIVGVEYDWEKSYTPWMTKRWKDYTPTKDTAFDGSPGYRKAFGLNEGTLLSGGAPVFLNVVKTEIIPFIEKKYRTTEDRGISGHSFGGLFVTYCLFSTPELFNRYGINSPSLWWDKKVMFKIEKTFSERNQSLPVHAFMSAGSMEGQSMTPVMTAFADTLKSRNYKGLNLTTHIFEDETHMSVVPAMISRTLRVLYGSKKE